jgi:hypothetical protein
MNTISNLIIELSKDPFQPDINFDAAEEYLRNNQTASAVSFYLRCVEYAEEGSTLGYASLLRMAQCFDDQRGREYSVTNCLLQAMAYDDTRPEAYWLLSRYHEKAGNWMECYAFASVGLGWSHGTDELPIEIGFCGEISLLFQMAIAAWWIGRKDESVTRLRALLDMDDLPEVYRTSVNDNLRKLDAK